MRERKRSNRRGVERRMELLEAIEAHVWLDGWEGLNARALAKTLGVSTGLLHHHFGSIEDLAVYFHEASVKYLEGRALDIRDDDLADRCRKFMERTIVELGMLKNGFTDAWTHAIRTRTPLTTPRKAISWIVRFSPDVPPKLRDAVTWLLSLCHATLVYRWLIGEDEQRLVQAFEDAGRALAAAAAEEACPWAVLEDLQAIVRPEVAQPRGTPPRTRMARALSHGLVNTKNRAKRAG